LPGRGAAGILLRRHAAGRAAPARQGRQPLVVADRARARDRECVRSARRRARGAAADRVDMAAAPLVGRRDPRVTPWDRAGVVLVGATAAAAAAGGLARGG